MLNMFPRASQCTRGSPVPISRSPTSKPSYPIIKKCRGFCLAPGRLPGFYSSDSVSSHEPGQQFLWHFFFCCLWLTQPHPHPSSLKASLIPLPSPQQDSSSFVQCLSVGLPFSPISNCVMFGVATVQSFKCYVSSLVKFWFCYSIIIKSQLTFIPRCNFTLWKMFVNQDIIDTVHVMLSYTPTSLMTCFMLIQMAKVFLYAS